jgi:putative transposase
MDKQLQKTTEYKQLMSQASQCTLQVLDRNWRSFFEATKDYKKYSEKYLGKPKIPKYKKKDGRFTWFLKNNQTYIQNGRLYFRLKVMQGYSFKTNVLGRLISVRFVPKGSIYVMEIVYETEIESGFKTPTNITGIDLGVNNFVTMTNNIGLQPIIINGKGIKSINQHYNKQRARVQSDVEKRNHKHWSNKLDTLTLKRNNKIKNFIHHTSTYIVKYCKENNIDTIVCGLNKTWKQECKMSKKVNQNFHFIPYDMLIKQLEYKCQENSINLIMTDESYTSGTSFLDNELPIKPNYNKKRRIHRGLFKSNTGQLINSDVNGSLQIIKKVFSDAFADGIKGCLTPTVINVVKTA